MNDIKQLHNRLIKLYSTFSPSEKKIATFLKKYPDDVVFYNIVSLGKKLKLSPSSISKFAKALGLNGFKDLQKIYRKNLVMTSVEGGFSEKHQIADLNKGNTTTTNIIDDIIKYDIHALKTLATEINPQYIDESVDMIHNAETVYIVGKLRSESIANWLGYTLTMLGKKNYQLSFSSNSMYESQASFFSDKDVLIAISFQFYSDTVINLTKKAKQKNCKVISITDGEFSPFYTTSNVCFCMPQENYLFSKSLSSAMSLALMITTALVQKNNKND